MNKYFFEINWPPVPDNLSSALVKLAETVKPEDTVNSTYFKRLLSTPGIKDNIPANRQMLNNVKTSGHLYHHNWINSPVHRLYKTKFYNDVNCSTGIQKSVFLDETRTTCIGGRGIVPMIMTTWPLPMRCVAILNCDQLVKFYEPKDSTKQADIYSLWNEDDVTLVEETVCKRNHWYAIDYNRVIISEMVTSGYERYALSVSLDETFTDLSYFEKYRI